MWFSFLFLKNSLPRSSFLCLMEVLILQKQSKLIDCIDALNWYRNDFTQLKYQLKKLMKNF